ncbi:MULTISPECIES: hypothetical protein [Kitasatospora]|uniref:Uncharacterized protein n=1 Tax=Kitasatospora setae (strain ATCC 33774 / DSM 43861 / JCM 3304 / KCC A-0304 / NBRC 14216 / KM-6054) TaxID=452652 RepID=E4N4C0_KITSK|nr:MULTISPECIES: hypothetical protein [Kitasatospora]BAJ26051.1 hypothetical protein KSE_02010 [Kitasatospora setae KM-6054]
MPDDLTPAQQLVVIDMDQKIAALLGHLGQPDLQALLPGTPAGGQVQQDLSGRFGALVGRLPGLGNLVKVNTSLNASMGANTLITSGANPQVFRLDLRPDLVQAVSASYQNTLTVIHELSHTITENHAFPVKDYAYRSGWAWGYLTPALSVVNADTYAQLAVRLAERADNGPGRYSLFGLVPAQREHLRGAAGQTVLGAALAWADLVLNRAWLRSLDATAHAKVDVPDANWATQQQTWAADPDAAQRVAFEGRLVGANLLSARYSLLGSTGLTTYGKWTVEWIASAVEEAKNLLSGLEVVPVADNGGFVSCSKDRRTLLVSRGVFGDSPVQLGGRILNAVLAAVAPSGFTAPAWAPRLRDVVDWLVLHDRPQEHAALAPLLTSLGQLPAVATTPAQWDALIQSLPRAVLTDTTARWQMLDGHVAAIVPLGAAAQARLRHLDAALTEDLGRIGNAARKLTASTADVNALLAQVNAIAARVTPLFPDAAARYEDIRRELNPMRH